MQQWSGPLYNLSLMSSLHFLFNVKSYPRLIRRKVRIIPLYTNLSDLNGEDLPDVSPYLP